MRIVTRGLGGGQGSGLILYGMTQDIVRIIRAGRTIAKDVYENFLEEFTIAAKLIEINGKELFSPIFNKRKFIIDESKKFTVIAKNKTVKKRDSDSISVTAKMKNIKRGLNGNN